MTTKSITESGMNFGPYASVDFFHIERSQHYEHIKDGIKMVEFLLIMHGENNTQKLLIVEAKNSCPKDLEEYIDKIKEKMTNGFMLGISACLNRHSAKSEEVPMSFKRLNIGSANICFVLVINGAPTDHLQHLQSALYSKLRKFTKIWSIPSASVVVLNEDLAKNHGLIKSDEQIKDI